MVEQDKQLPPVNIIIAGITGAGKSTLLNAVFGKKLAETDIGKPQTVKAALYNADNSEDLPIRIWDTVGFELSENGKRTQETLDNIREIIRKKSENGNKFDKIHAIWYCINAESKRFQDMEAKFIVELTKVGVPFTVVLTQCIAKKDNDRFQQQIHQILMEYGVIRVPIVQVLAEKKEVDIGDETQIIPARGLHDLIELTIDKMPDYLKIGFIAAQRVEKNYKRACATEVIEKYVAGAKESFWDKVWLVNISTVTQKLRGMFGTISALYNTKLNEVQLEKVINIATDEWKGQITTLLHPYQGHLSEELEQFFQRTRIETNLRDEEYKHNEKAALFLAVTGFKFMNAIEGVWDDLTEEELEDMDKVMGKLREKLKLYFNLVK